MIQQTFFGTWRGGRTLTLVKELDFESSASANSAIQAIFTKLKLIKIQLETLGKPFFIKNY